MCLIHTDTLELTEFFDINVPEYAILSHTWDQEEVSFQDMKDGNVKQKAGYSKIHFSSRQAEADGLKYVWVDTCCIDKTSSAELSEAINSMFEWHKSAKICYAYLADVSKGDASASASKVPWDSAFARSKWFTRGWTLQELIASSSLRFYDKDWNELGTKQSLRVAISELTGVNVEVLQGHVSPLAVSIARRMSWAAKRQTTRMEDTAYCLMGIFDVNMPLLYGEGKKAFTRLQEEVLKESDDHSLFAWKQDEVKFGPSYRGILAESPAEFADSRDIVPFQDWSRSAPYSMTNKGLSIRLYIKRDATAENQSIFMVALNCRMGGDQTNLVGIKLICVRGDQYARTQPHILFNINASMFDLKTIFIRKKPLEVDYDLSRSSWFRIISLVSVWGYALTAVYLRTDRTRGQDSSIPQASRPAKQEYSNSKTDLEMGSGRF